LQERGHRSDACHPPAPPSLEQAHENGFDLIFSRVGKDDGVASQFVSSGKEGSPPRIARRCLETSPAGPLHPNARQQKGNILFPAKSLCVPGVPVRRPGPQAVVDVKGQEPILCSRTRFLQKGGEREKEGR
jgi:hypothetical protein